MVRKLVLLTISLMFLIQPLATQTQEEVAQMKEYSDAIGEFGFSLFARLQEGMPGNNIFISPLSIEFSLNMAMNGARGETRDAMRKALGLSALSDGAINAAVRSLLDAQASADSKIHLNIANSLWYNKNVDIRVCFFRDNRAFNAEIRGLDFNAPDSVDIINNWISRKTQDMIPSMLDRVERDMALFAINAIYFNGEWANAFDGALNKEKPFTLGNGARKNVTLMNQNGTYRYLANDTLSIAELPYGNGRYSMYILLPREGLSPADLLKGLDWKRCKALLAALTRREGNISIPIFKTTFGAADLIPPLTGLGMGPAFTHGADFSGISETEELYINMVLHKAVIEVSERGTRAAAATVTGIRTTGMQIAPPFSFVADRPFAYIIMDNASSTPLFIGKLESPE